MGSETGRGGGGGEGTEMEATGGAGTGRSLSEPQRPGDSARFEVPAEAAGPGGETAAPSRRLAASSERRWFLQHDIRALRCLVRLDMEIGGFHALTVVSD